MSETTRSAHRLRGSRVKILREKRGLTQAELAELLDTDARRIISYEKEHSNPNSEVVSQLAKYLDTSTEYLLGFTDDDAPQLVNTDLTADERALIIAARSGDAAEFIRLAALVIKHSPK